LKILVLFSSILFFRRKVSKRIVRFKAISLREPRLENTANVSWLSLRCFQPLLLAKRTEKRHNKKFESNFLFGKARQNWEESIGSSGDP
jgi:hypothetical protein